jgi:hypothetical protein
VSPSFTHMVIMSKTEQTRNLLIYSPEGEDIQEELILKDETVWASQETISNIFHTEKIEISGHLESIYESGELIADDTLQVIQSVITLKEVQFYSLDAIISVGYRVNSKKATKFRIWATGILSQYLKDGFVINEDLLRSDPEKLNELAAKIRELRSNEKNIYSSVRECFKLASSDYEPSSKEVKKFYGLLQDKFHHAITRMTASKLILDRADHTDENMGLQSIKGAIPTKKEAKTGKNYLDENEIYRMHLLSEQFLLYAESTALMGKKMTMKGLHHQLDNLLQLNGYPVFEGYKDYLKNQALEHAGKEWEAFIEIKKLEHIGINVELDLYYLGEYDEYKEQVSLISPNQLNKAIAIHNI